MNCLFKITFILIFTLIASTAFAFNRSIIGDPAGHNTISADSIKALDSNTMIASGNVVLTIDNGKNMMFTSKTVVNNEKVFIYEGDVKIASDNFVVNTQKANAVMVDQKLMLKWRKPK
jgi:lipopolysaccharide assembly outer membrane protein LptD (OstA)